MFMNSTESAGASRRSRRLALILSVSALAAVAVFGLIRRSDARDEYDAWDVKQQFSKPDAEFATHLLQSVRGSNPVMCASLDRSFNNGSWGSSMLPVVDSISGDDAETARWIGRDHLDRNVLDIVRPAFSDADACVRRVAARLAGNVNTERLDRELSAELASSSAATRKTAVLALGFNGEKPVAPKLRSMLQDQDEGVRLAAAWALGSTEDEASKDVMVQLLKSDRNPRMREVAAWALGRILD
jgi:hypothetical protein